MQIFIVFLLVGILGLNLYIFFKHVRGLGKNPKKAIIDYYYDKHFSGKYKDGPETSKEKKDKFDKIRKELKEQGYLKWGNDHYYLTRNGLDYKEKIDELTEKRIINRFSLLLAIITILLTIIGIVSGVL